MQRTLAIIAGFAMLLSTELVRACHSTYSNPPTARLCCAGPDKLPRAERRSGLGACQMPRLTAEDREFARLWNRCRSVKEFAEQTGRSVRTASTIASRLRNRGAVLKRGSGSVTHGASRTKLFAIWKDMRRRCNSKSCPMWRYYGARGIRVYRKWDGDFLAFRDWAVSHGYAPGLELDRRNTNGDYTPRNCRWVSHGAQMMNRRKQCNGRQSRFKGVNLTSNGRRWRSQICVNGKRMFLGTFAKEIDAAKAYDAAARKHFGEFAMPNFPRKR